MSSPSPRPAAVLRRPFVASALVAGAVVPDYFSVPFWLDLFIALACLLIFHLLMKAPLLALAPGAVSARLSAPGSLKLPDLFRVVVATFIGALLQVVAGSLVYLVPAIWLVYWWRSTTPGPVLVVATRARYAVLIAAAVLGVVGAVLQLVRAEDIGVRLGLTGFVGGALVALGWYAVIWQALRLRMWLRRERVAAS